eukprot:SAG11_NODE_1175_length_5601_cov_15.947110_8_plen_43_part_00
MTVIPPPGELSVVEILRFLELAGVKVRVPGAPIRIASYDTLP